jgi:hypothetical protein
MKKKFYSNLMYSVISTTVLAIAFLNIKIAFTILILKQDYLLINVKHLMHSKLFISF